MKTMGATMAKTHFLSLLNEVEQKRESFTVTRNGRKVAELIPVRQDKDPLSAYKFGGFDIVGDIISPAGSPGDWECD